MRRESIFIFGSSLLITVLIVGVIYYLTVVQPLQNAVSKSAPPLHSEQSVGNAPAQETNAPQWTDRPIKCVDEEIGEFWTNARDCESADLENRISNAQSYQNTNQPNSKSANSPINNYSPSKTRAKRKPNIRQVAKDVPDGLSVSCKFAVGRALETERPLSAADDPAQSVWRENYCKWIREVREEDCNVSSDLFYYGHLCGFGL